MKIVVDTNIIFSTLLNSNGTIGDLIYNSGDTFIFYSCSYMRNEIHRHWSKLRQISMLTEEELQTSYDLLLTRLIFINEKLIPKKIWLNANEIVVDIDPDDIDFVALTRFLKAGLWTGDKSLYQGLKARRFRSVFNTGDMVSLRTKLSNF